MTKALPRKRARPKTTTKRVVQEKTELQPITTKIEDVDKVEDFSWEDEGGFVPIAVSDDSDARKIQYGKMNKAYKKGVSEEEFLSKEDLTGFGPNSKFTNLEDR